MEAEVRAKTRAKIIKPDHELLEPGELGAVLELTVKDKDGKVKKHHVLKSKSFVRQFLELLWIEANQIPEIGPIMVKDIDGTQQWISESSLAFACDAPIGDVSYGIVVGTGITISTINDYKLEYLIAHGTEAGQLQYGDVAFGAPASDATTSHFTVTRDFANGSGNTITVNEIGLYVKGYKYDVTYYFMIIKDVIPGGIDVLDGETLTVNYREQAVI